MTSRVSLPCRLSALPPFPYLSLAPHSCGSRDRRSSSCKIFLILHSYLVKTYKKVKKCTYYKLNQMCHAHGVSNKRKTFGTRAPVRHPCVSVCDSPSRSRTCNLIISNHWQLPVEQEPEKRNKKSTIDGSASHWGRSPPILSTVLSPIVFCEEFIVNFIF